MSVFSEISALNWVDARGVLLFLFVFLILSDYLKNRIPKDFPPGPGYIPLIGDALRIQPSKLFLNFDQFAEKYGPIFSLRIMGGRLVVVNGYKLVREVLVDNGDDYADRPVLPMLHEMVGSNGVSMSNGYQWRRQRRFALQTLRDFGLGKKSLEPSIQQECQYLAEVFDQYQGAPFDPKMPVTKAVSNVISCLVFGKRFEYNEKQQQFLIEHVNEIMVRQSGAWATLYNMYPALVKHLPGPHKTLFARGALLWSFIEDRVREHRVDHDPSLPRDYIDCFLTEMDKNEDYEAKFDLQNLTVCVVDLFIAGTETTTTTLHWGLLYMAYYPEIQKKVQAELDAVVGSSRPASMSDRDSTPYTYAVIQEIQRMGNIIPLNLLRMASKDTSLGKYTIPKGTVVLAALNSVLRDKSIWETPYTFNPQHFLDQDGQARKREAFLPFSAGKRVCLGEQLARMELYLFFTSLLQRFSFSAPPGETLSVDPLLLTIHGPKHYQLCATPR